MRKLKVIFIVVIVVFIILQFFQPEKTNPDSDSSLSIAQQTSIPPQVAGLIGIACRDCHTHDTVWPMHSYISPVSWLVDYDVRHGRAKLNFSLWGNYEVQRAWVFLDEICRQIKSGHMPPNRYLLVHPEARLNENEKESICKWTETEKECYQK